MRGKITLIQILLVFVLVICAGTVVENVRDRHQDEKEISEVVEQHATLSPKPDQATDQERIAKIKAVYEQNNDTVGWVKIQDTSIDYPVLHNTQSNAYYLHRGIDREYSSSGIPFLDYQCKPDASNDNTIIYAHNMRNGTMFHDLLNYKDKSFYDTHKIIMYDTLQGTGEYEIFAVLRTSVGSKNEFKYYGFIDAKTPKEFDEFVATCIKQSLYKTDIIPVYGDKLITLSTCSYNTNNERFVVFGRKL